MLAALLFAGSAALPPAALAYHIRGTGVAALVGHDLTDPEDDGAPHSNVNYNATFAASEEANFSGTAFNQGAFNVFNNQLGSGDKWCCGTENNFPTNPISVDATFPAAHVLRRFTLTSGEDAAERDPRVWKIQGSNDGVNFTDIYARNNPTTSVWTDRSQVVEFAAGIDYAVPAAYTTIRFLCTATGSTTGARYQLGEIEYLDTAASLTVTTTADEDNGTSDPTQGTGTSLREALAYAATLTGPQTITFSDSTAFSAVNFYDGTAHTITLGGTQLVIASSVTITGPGGDVLTVERSHAGGTPDFRIFELSNGTLSGPTVAISGLTIANGKGTGSVPDTLGGGILNDHGTLRVQDCAFVQNFALGGGGAIYNLATGGSATLNIINSTFTQNTSTIDGGALVNDGGTPGTSAVMSVVNSTFDRSSANRGGHIFNYAYQGSATLDIANSTFFQVAANNGAGIANDGRSSGSAIVRLANTILTAGSQPTLTKDEGTYTSLGHNLTDDAGGGFLTAAGDQINTNPKLDTNGLQDNGGPTKTIKLLPGSPAIDAGDNSLAVDGSSQALTSDQRGLGFDRIVQGKSACPAPMVDIGAFEVQVITFAPGIAANGVQLDAADGALNLKGATIGATPPGGSFSGPGVDSNGQFHPETLDPGTYTITYTTTVADAYNNTGSASFTITITAANPYLRIIATFAPDGSGIDVPGETPGTKFTQLGLASMDDATAGMGPAGLVGARVRIKPPGGAEVPAIYQGTANTVAPSFLGGGPAAPGGIVVRGGDPAPAANGGTLGTFASFREPVFGNGYYAFGATITGAGLTRTNDTGLWSSRSGQLARVAAEGGTAPGADGLPMSGVLFDQIQSYALSADGDSLTFVATLKGTGVKGTNKTGVWQYSPMSTQLIFRTGDLFSVGGGQKAVKSLKLFVPAKTIPGQRRSYAGARNRVMAFASFVGGHQALLGFSDFGFGAFRYVAITDDNVGHPGLPSLNGNGNFAMRAGLAIGAAYTHGPGKVTARTDQVILTGNGVFNIGIFAQESDPVSGTIPDVFTAFEEPAYNDNFAVAFFADVNKPGLPAKQKRVLFYSGPPNYERAILARTGTPAAGLQLGELWKSFTAMVLPDSDYGPAFLGTLDGPGVTRTNSIGLWATDLDGTVRLLLRTGDTVKINGLSKTVSLITTLGAALDSPGQGRYVDREGNISATLTFTDGSTALVHFGMPTVH